LHQQCNSKSLKSKVKKAFSCSAGEGYIHWGMCKGWGDKAKLQEVSDKMDTDEVSAGVAVVWLRND